MPALEALERVDYSDEGEGSVTIQLRSVGIYNDPNDLCLLLVVGFVISLYEIFERKGVIRVLWACPMAVLLYALIMTRHAAGCWPSIWLFVLFVSRFGVKKAIFLASLAVARTGGHAGWQADRDFGRARYRAGADGKVETRPDTFHTSAVDRNRRGSILRGGRTGRPQFLRSCLR